MDVGQAHANSYQHARPHLQQSHPMQQPPQSIQGFGLGFVPYTSFYGQQGAPRGLTTTHPTSAAPQYNTAPPNALRYSQQQQYNLPVHNGVPIQRPHPQPPNQVPIAPVQTQEAVPPESSTAAQDGKVDKHIKGLRIIPEPPGKDEWRQRLFEVEGLLILTEEEFQIYFPHVDNVYSHRSTQEYKKKPFVSHYYDCRLKGRPAGTPKSDDPNKKKRKRVARERDLCDVKIKITEYLPGATRDEIATHLSQQPRGDGINAEALLQRVQGAIGQSLQSGAPMQVTKRFYTIQRVNGTGPNAKEGENGRHKHTIEESDRIKKNSVIRWLAMQDREKRKAKPSEKKTYHTKATGPALGTVKKHSKDHPLKLYGSCFCPFVQRVWIALEYKKLDYQYIEIDPYKKPDWYLKLNPRGLVPTLQDGDWCCYESTVLMEYLEDINQGKPLLPSDPKKRAHSRLWSDHINRKIVPRFYSYLIAQETSKQIEEAAGLKNEIEKLVNAADAEGPFFLGPELSFVDVQVAPWVIRLNKVLKPYRGWPDVDKDSRWGKWVVAIEADPFVKATTSGDELYLDSYERYAENRPNTSQVADAINSGKGLP
ncbi:uncharacterized protein PV09_02645 [Verruconis gallopava]|uniref:GST N-terminal domain-containing protein n=1 Tax=Verruconis gallopava TaxID=253628 RepID=A0A0D1Z240_9PEZI|nr:uncharacterized protein PV09_02645 [Verruconis gallopava]KIW06987.1 hypothetical protein PV09_02645 [Verruconis gallopava]